MPQRITRDHNMFRRVVAGKLREELKKYITTGGIFRQRGTKGKILVPIPRINLPHFTFGKPGEGVGRGEGGEGDKVGEDPGRGQGDRGATDQPGEGMLVDVDMSVILEALQQELELPNPRKKVNDVYEEIKIKYNSLSKIGPPSLLHLRKTMLQCMKRTAAMGLLDQKTMVPGYNEPIRVFTPIKDDMRYRQYNEIKIPSSNAVVFFARDISGSMGPFKCDIVSDIAWWIQSWIKHFYERVELCYVVHDTAAKEVSEQQFYKMRMGGGTICSSAVKWINKQLKHRYPPTKWNVYIFYFSDGDNWSNDNELFCNFVEKEFTPSKISLFGMTQILSWGYNHTLKQAIDAKIADGTFDNQFIRTSAVKSRQDQESRWGWHWDETMPEDERNAAIKGVIKDLLGVDRKQVFDKVA